MVVVVDDVTWCSLSTVVGRLRLSKQEGDHNSKVVLMLRLS